MKKALKIIGLFILALVLALLSLLIFESKASRTY